ncbi:MULTISPECIES: hypothetical protein [Bacillus cereus group]|uniref:hypothetical protein n=1 Tax=Bacillus cereus group TaxID=86661 RepID=UPI00032F35FD|nr:MULTISPECIES: hypothetical protein [Bacillus cereus group]EOO44393.1 hypothetical protein ICK_06168 [Bacillus cereus BAG1X2-2]UYX56292.1 hypothetical protein M3Y14_34150 [Bacillus thuringiensis]
MAAPCSDDFNFNDQVLGSAGFSSDKEAVFKETNSPFSVESEVQTSFLLSNALLNILLRKKIISQNEVTELVSELFEVYQQKKGLK